MVVANAEERQWQVGSRPTAVAVRSSSLSDVEPVSDKVIAVQCTPAVTANSLDSLLTKEYE